MKVLATILFLTVAGCGFDQEARQGAEGEVCNGRDTDCRPGLICEEQLCVVGASVPNDCESVCQKIRACGSNLSGCVYSCRLTTDPWSERARASFGECVVDDLACAEVMNTFAPQTCYERIPIPSARASTCETLLAARESCGVPDPDHTFIKTCRASARVDAASRWRQTERCTDEIGTCEALQQCLSF